ncbi:MAG: hypothetical protein PHU04_03115 [Candidatus Peribacteraceae bacterium]|nr:hypothetical protein [Candidatus Peribacteraceae bacterium]
MSFATLHHIALLCSTLLPQRALAYDPNQGIQAAAGGRLMMFGTNFETIAEGVALLFVPIVTGIAILVVVASGLAMVFSQGEEEMTTARRALIGGILAIMLAALAGVIRTALEPGGFSLGGAISYGDLSPEIIGIADWLSSIAAVIAILMLIVSGIRAVVSYGSDQGSAQMRTAVIAAVSGFTIIVLRVPIKAAIVDDMSPGTFVSDVIVPIVNAILGFVGLLAVIFIVIAGIMMILNMGNDDQYQKARNLILRVAIGLLVVLASAAIVNIVFA